MKITIGSTYYNNPDNLLEFYAKHIDHVDEMIIVDDGSENPVTNFLSPNEKLRLFRVKKDYGFNSHGCRNLIASKSSNDWMVLMDLDRLVVDTNAFYDIKNTKLSENVRYRFVAVALSGNMHKSVNDFLIHRSHFFSVGGYDEELIGIRDGDRQFFQQLLKFGPERLLCNFTISLTRPPSLLIRSVSENAKHMTKHLEELLERRIKKPEPNKPILTFEWEEIR